jgi:hypothetical protein
MHDYREAVTKELSKATSDMHYLKLVTKTEKLARCRTRYYVGESFIIDVTRIETTTAKNDIMRIWEKAGYIKKVLPSRIHIDTYYTDTEGRCWSYYNITVKRSEDGTRRVIDFDYLLEATSENEKYLVDQCIRLREMDIRL